MVSRKEKGRLWQIEEFLEVATENVVQAVTTTVVRMAVLGALTIVTGVEIAVKAVMAIVAGESQVVIRIMIDATRGKTKIAAMVEMLVMIDAKILMIEAEAILRVEIMETVTDILGMIEIEGENDRLEGKATTSDLNVVWLMVSRRLWGRIKESRMVGAARCPGRSVPHYQGWTSQFVLRTFQQL
jgi:hypothetical protein